jgi:hypothetical protein
VTDVTFLTRPTSQDEGASTIARKRGSWRRLIGVPGRWRRNQATHCTDRSANRGAEGSTMPTGSGSPDCGPATGTDETTPNEPLYGIVWIGASRQTEHESHGNQKGSDPWFHRAILQRLLCNPCQQITVCDAVSVCHFWNLSGRGCRLTLKIGLTTANRRMLFYHCGHLKPRLRTSNRREDMRHRHNILRALIRKYCALAIVATVNVAASRQRHLGRRQRPG